MTQKLVCASQILDAAAELIIEGGFDRLTIQTLASRSEVSEEQIVSHFGTVDDALVTMLNREFTGIYRTVVDHIERDPRGGLLSRIYFYTLSATYERPLARVLYLTDRDAMNTIMRRAHSMNYVPSVRIRASLVEGMQLAGMVRPEVDAESISHLITIFSAGLALTAPHEKLDLIVRGVTDVLARVVDADVVDTAPGKAAFYEWALSL